MKCECVIRASRNAKADSCRLRHAWMICLIDLIGFRGLDFYWPRLITCLMMPEASGIDLITHVRAIDSDIPILVLSTVSNETVIVEAFRVGADDYLRKPFIPKDLLQRLEHIISTNEISI